MSVNPVLAALVGWAEWLAITTIVGANGVNALTA